MAQKFLSPGVFTTEIDQSFLAQGVAGIGACMVGRTKKGPAFVPTLVRGLDEFADKFGSMDPTLQMPYAAKNYLKNSSAMTVVRVLGHADGLSTTSGYVPGGVTAIVTNTSSIGQVGAVIHHSGTAAVVTVGPVVGDITKFTINIGTAFAATASFVSSSADYVEKVLNTDPTKYDTYGHYLYQTFKYANITGSQFWNHAPMSGALSGFLRNFEGGVTPYVKSQLLGGMEFSLFRFHSRGHGRATNEEVKVMIANVKPSPAPLVSPYGTFDVVIRKMDDTDQRPVTLESFVGLTLDPDSNNYLLRRMGDTEEAFDTTQRKFIKTAGTFSNKSKYVRVELNTAANLPKEALPWGHRGYTKAKWLHSASAISTPVIGDLPLQLDQYDRQGNIDTNIAFGISFVSGGIVDRMRAQTDGVTGTGYITTDSEFSMKFLTSSYLNGRQVWKYDTATVLSNMHLNPVYSSASLYKFCMPLEGGFDGWDLRVADPLYLSNTATETNIGVVATNRALDTIANPDAFDMNLLAVPGIHNLKITDKARQIANDRADCLFIMDVTGSSVTEAIQQLQSRQMDDNYAAAYYPDLILDDKTNKRNVRVSPSVAILGAMAFSDRVGQVFFAPAGLNRGGLGQFDIVDVVDRLTFQDRNDLYDNRLNPIATFPNEGIVVFGQKTMQLRASALDRINVRRLLIFAKKTIAGAAKFLLFEPNNPVTWERFSKTVNPILAKIQQDQGLVRFKVVMDTTTNTDDIVDRNIMAGKIFLQPTKAAEFIDLSFVITNAGVSFGE